MIAMHMYPGDVAFFPLLDRTRSQFQCELTRVAAPLGLWKISTTSLVTGSHGSLQRAETFMSFLASSSKLQGVDRRDCCDWREWEHFAF